MSDFTKKVKVMAKKVRPSLGSYSKKEGGSQKAAAKRMGEVTNNTFGAK